MTYVVAHLMRADSEQYDSLNLYRFADRAAAETFVAELNRRYGIGSGHYAPWPSQTVMADTDDPRGWDDPDELREFWSDLDDLDAH